jgi:hypothetical protein
MNLYTFNHNNPLRYLDKDGCFAFAIPLIAIAFGVESATITTTVYAVAGAVLGAAVGYGTYQGVKYLDGYLDSPISSTSVEESQPQAASGKNSEKNQDPRFPGTPQDLEKDSDWVETTHSDARKAGHRKFKNSKTG